MQLVSVPVCSLEITRRGHANFDCPIEVENIVKLGSMNKNRLVLRNQYFTTRKKTKSQAVLIYLSNLFTHDSHSCVHEAGKFLAR